MQEDQFSLPGNFFEGSNLDGEGIQNWVNGQFGKSVIVLELKISNSQFFYSYLKYLNMHYFCFLLFDKLVICSSVCDDVNNIFLLS